MIIANVFNLAFGRFGIKLFSLVAKVPSSIVYPIALLLCLGSAWISGGKLTGCIIMVIFGIVGYLMRLLRIPVITSIIAFVLGRMRELPLIQMMLISQGDFLQILSYPVEVAFILAGI